VENVNPDTQIKEAPGQFTKIGADLVVSEGSNDSNLVDIFRERLKFKVAGTPIFLPRGFDFYEIGNYYGKVDTLGRVVIPKSKSLIKVDTKFTDDELIYLNKDLYSLYLDFFEDVKLQFAINKLDIALFLNVFRIQKGAESFDRSEYDYKTAISAKINDIYKSEVVGKTKRLVDDATNFEEYMDMITKLFKLGKIDKSVLYSEFLLSGANSFTNSGMMFEIGNEVPYDNNYEKFLQYYNSPGYGRIALLLLKYGMRYDANTPWRFVLDLNLDPATKKRGGSSKQQYFDKYFDVIEGTTKEMNLFFEAIYLSYLKLLEESPFIVKNEQILSVCVTGRKKNIKSNKSYSVYRDLFSRQDITLFLQKNSNSNILRYAQILNSLYKKRININHILLEISNKLKLKKGLDKDAIVRYTFNKMKYC